MSLARNDEIRSLKVKVLLSSMRQGNEARRYRRHLSLRASALENLAAPTKRRVQRSRCRDTRALAADSFFPPLDCHLRGLIRYSYDLLFCLTSCPDTYELFCRTFCSLVSCVNYRWNALPQYFTPITFFWFTLSTLDTISRLFEWSFTDDPRQLED